MHWLRCGFHSLCLASPFRNSTQNFSDFSPINFIKSPLFHVQRMLHAIISIQSWGTSRSSKWHHREQSTNSLFRYKEAKPITLSPAHWFQLFIEKSFSSILHSNESQHFQWGSAWERKHALLQLANGEIILKKIIFHFSSFADAKMRFWFRLFECDRLTYCVLWLGECTSYT